MNKGKEIILTAAVTAAVTSVTYLAAKNIRRKRKTEERILRVLKILNNNQISRWDNREVIFECPGGACPCSITEHAFRQDHNTGDMVIEGTAVISRECRSGIEASLSDGMSVNRTKTKFSFPARFLYMTDAGILTDCHRSADLHKRKNEAGTGQYDPLQDEAEEFFADCKAGEKKCF